LLAKQEDKDMIEKNPENQDLDLVEAILAEQLALAQASKAIFPVCSCITCSACTCGGMN
jgi:hypothetical protein